MDDNELFSEIQYFHQPWLWLLIGWMAALSLWAFVQQIVLGVPWGNNPGSDELVIVLTVVLVLIVPLVFLSMHLRVVVRTDRLVVQFFPLHLRPRTIARDAIVAHRATAYRPLRDFGGWGIRYGSMGKAYIMSRDRGVLLELRNGDRLLIGSRRAEELDAAIALMMSRP